MSSNRAALQYFQTFKSVATMHITSLTVLVSIIAFHTDA